MDLIKQKNFWCYEGKWLPKIEGGKGIKEIRELKKNYHFWEEHDPIDSYYQPLHPTNFEFVGLVFEEDWSYYWGGIDLNNNKFKVKWVETLTTYI